MSEANKDEAERCFDLATEALSAGEKDKAQRLLTKSLRLYPLDKAKSLLDLLTPSTKSRTPTPQAPSSTSSKPSTTESTTSSGSSTPSGSAEQLAEVRRILKCSNYYEILQVEKGVETTVIKKAYRKLALSVHPDRNPVNGASDAFKKVGAAFACLSDEGKRREYDMTGRTDDQPRPQASAYRRGGYGNTYYYQDDEFDPFELFRQHGFFYNAVPANRGQTRFRHHYTPNANGQGQTPPLMSAIMQLAPLLILLMFAWFSLRGSDPKFSLDRTMTHPHSHVTTVGNVAYYTSEKLVDPKYIKQIERDVIHAYAQRLETHCQHQRNEQARRDSMARWRGTVSEKPPLTSCDAFTKLSSDVNEAVRQGIMAY